MKVIFYFLLFFSILGRAQKNNFIDNYYPKINKAELSIVTGNYRDALKYYNAAFNEVNVGFAKDYYNALICALSVGRKAQVSYLLLHLFKKGLTNSFAQDDTIISNTKKKLGPSVFDRLRRKGQAFYNKTADLLLRKELENMFNSDQQFRAMEGSYQKYGDTIKKIDDRNVIRLKEIIAKKGFPSESMIGFPEKFPFSQNLQPYYVILHHHSQALTIGKAYAITFFDELTIAVKQGKLQPHTAGYLFALQGLNDFNSFGMEQLKQSDGTLSGYFINKPSLEDGRKIDSLRYSIGLEPLTDFYKKVIFGRSHKVTHFQFKYSGSLNIFTGISKEEFEQSVKKAIEMGAYIEINN
jgi:hypothetical protein